MKKLKRFIIITLFVSATPLSFWWGVSRGHWIDSMLVNHGYELIRLQKDIQKLQYHIAELEIKNHKLRVQMNNNRHTNRVYENALKAYRYN